MDQATAPPPAAPAVAAPRRRRWIWAAAAALALLLAGVPLALGSLLRSEAGTAWLLAQVPGLRTEGLQGALWSDRLAVQHLAWQGTAGTLEIDALALGGLRWQVHPGPGQWLGLQAGQVQAQRVRWRSAPASGAASAPPAPPTQLHWPLQLRAAVAVQSLEIDNLAPVQDLAFTLHLGADGGRAHLLQGLALRWERLQARAGQARIASLAPLALDAALELAAADGSALPWQAQLRASGTLERIELAATLQGSENAALDLQASLVPFARWPLAALSARTEGLDLASLASGWPQTRLRGTAVLQSSAADQPLQATLQLFNDAPGRWNKGRLPLRQVDAVLGGRLDAPDTLELQRFDLRLGDAAGPAGRVQGEGRWQGTALTLDARLDALAPQRLDSRAAAMTLSGPLALRMAGLPSPNPPAPAVGDAPATPTAELRAQLAGRIDGAPGPVTIELQARAAAGDLQVQTLQARSGGASLQLQASARLEGARWSLQSRGELVEFDPVPWWPGPEGSAWRRGPHRLNATWEADLSAPADAASLAPATLLQRLRGDARFALERSQLAGVPLQATLVMDQAAGARVAGTLVLGGNRLQLDGRADTAGDGAADRWRVELQAPALAALAPLAALHPALAGWAPGAGSATAQATLQGRWPTLQSTGQATLQGLRAGPLSVADGQLQWQAGGSLQAPLNATLDLGETRFDGQRLRALHAELGGSLQAHRLRAVLALPLQPGPALARGLGLTTGRGTRISLHAEGGWAAGAEGGRWAGRVAALGVDAWDGQRLRAPLDVAGPPPAADARWLDARDLQLEALFDAGGGLRRLRADPGRLVLAGGLALHWDEVLYESAGGRLQLLAQVERFAVAPLLARAQPTMGWTGDLVLGARIELRAGERFDADIVVEREGGDLQLRDAADNLLPLGLTDLRLGLSAHEGIWFFTQALAGATLGELGGALRVRTGAAQRWPGPDAPLDGTVQLRVANLGVWSSWVPAGWRLQGQLQGSASFGGRFGAPQVDGDLDGSGLGVRNLLQGVNVHDGDVALRLRGERATIERFSLRAGAGTLTIRGGGTLGAEPSARLALTAERFQLLGRIDRRLIASGQAELTLRPLALGLNGNFVVDEGLFDLSRADAPSLDDDVVVRRPGAAAAAGPAPDADAPKRQVDVAVDIDLGRQLRVRGRGVNTLLAGQLRLTAPGGRMAVTGSVNTVGGTYAAYGQQLVIERGLVAFSGAIDNPRLDVLALRPKLDIEVGVAITGTAQAPRVRLYSNPELGDTEKLSWLVLGRDPGSLGRNDTALLQRAAVALLSGEGESTSDTLIRNLGLDDLSLRQSDDGTVRETIVTLGKQISDRWYVGYERGVNATTGTWQLIYRAARRFTLRLQSGLDNSLDAIWVWRVP